VCHFAKSKRKGGKIKAMGFKSMYRSIELRGRRDQQPGTIASMHARSAGRRGGTRMVYGYPQSGTFARARHERTADAAGEGLGRPKRLSRRREGFVSNTEN